MLRTRLRISKIETKDCFWWNKLDLNIRNSASHNIFKENLHNFIRPSPNSTFDIHNSYGIKLLTRLNLGFSRLQEDKFKHCFQDTFNPLCDCGNNIEIATLVSKLP